MNNTKANVWLFNKKTKDITFSYEVKQKIRFIKGSLFAVILGLIIGGIIIAVQNVNPFEYLKNLFQIGFNGLFVNQTIQWLCIYIIAALAVGIGFKSGMFNIGVAGQMLMGSGVAIIFFKLAVEPNLKPGETMNAGFIIVMFLICAGTGAIMAGIAGALKALFNIHEVVTTIMLNWTAWYLMKYLFNKFADTIGGQGIQSSGSIPGNSLTINGSAIAIPIILAVIAVIVIAVLLSKTTFGFKLKSVGASPDASKYAGYNVKAKMIDAMLISGLLAGVASFINIFTITPNITFSVDTLPGVGYDSIAITLVAFNNPIGTVFSSFLWAVLQSGGASTASLFNLPTQMSQLIFGVIVYFAAISVVFINFFPIIKLRIMIALTSSKADQIKIKNLRKQQLKYRKELLNINSSKDVQEYKKFINEQIAEQRKLLNGSSQNKDDIQVINKAIKDYKNDMNLFVKEYRKNLKEEIKKISNQIAIIKKQNYVEKINSAREGINRREFERIRSIEQDALSKTSLIKSNVLSLKDTYKKDLKDKNNWLKDKLKELKKEYKFKLTQNAVWSESETGMKNHYWEMRNGKIEAKATINKIKINSHNEILNLKSDYQMDKLNLRSQYKDDLETYKQKERVMFEQLQQNIASVEAKEKEDISNEKALVKQLVETYKTTKAANEKEQKAILADKKAVEIKEKEISEILNVWDNRLATLVDIKLAYKLKNKQVDKWYAEQKQQIMNVYHDLQNLIDEDKAKANYKVVKEALDSFKNSIKDLGHDNDLNLIQTKQKLLKQLIKKIRSVWTDEYSIHDNIRWSKVRYRTYLYVDNEQAKLNKLQVVINADNQIKNVKTKSKYIKKMYSENIKRFKEEYFANKKANFALAQQNYHKQIENFIHELETSSFSSKQLKEVK